MKDSNNLKDILSTNLKRYLDRKGVTQTDMARDLNIPETTVSNWMKAETYPRPDKIQLMADYFNVRRSDLTEEQPTNLVEIQPNFVKVPILGKIACGEPLLVAENIEGYTYEPVDSLPNGNIFSLIAKGDSMEPTIPDNAIVLLKQQSDVESGEIAAVQLNEDTEAVLKRIKKQNGTVLLVSDNHKYMPIIVNEQNPARIIGKAISYKVQL